ncbi:TolC family protein [Adhaeribacter soli]|uniref:TolC family protein n=1 Tax=Adhaeribacter soli TaxID=2607655 RepID=A0A5N1J759_9BACT|nr:TolC family protein [Adhaeribacter soli]KAA9341027.1 TolC family protein [Adhaeribacter soli]
MFRHVKSNLLLFLLFFSGRIVHAQSRAVSLAEALQFAQQNQLTVHNKQYNVQVNEARLRQEKAARYPEISGAFDMRYNQQLPTVILPGEFRNLPAQNIPVVFGTKYAATAALEGNYAVFDPERKYNTGKAKLQENISRNELLVAQTDLALEVRKAYYACLLNHKKIKLTLGNLGRSETFLRNTQTLFQNGQVQPVDVDRAQFDVQSQQAELQKATLNLNQNLLSLKYQMGFPLDSAIVLTDTLLLSGERQAVFLPDELKVEARPEYRNLQLQQEQENLLLTRNRHNALPTLRLYGYYGSQAFREKFNFTNTTEKWYPVSYFGAELNWLLFQGFLRRAQVQESKIALKIRHNELLIFERDYVFQTYSKLLAMQTEQQNVHVREANVQLAEKILNVTRIRFENSLVQSQEVTDAANDLLEAQTSYLNALYDFILARLEYERIQGK